MRFCISKNSRWWSCLAEYESRLSRCGWRLDAENRMRFDFQIKRVLDQLGGIVKL